MADYLKIFETQADYDSYIASEYPKPNVSYIEATDTTIFTNYQDGPDGNPYIIDSALIDDWSATTFHKNAAVLSVTVPEGVTTLENYALQSCPNLTEVSLPSTLTTIGQGAFAQCTSLTEIEIPEGVSTIQGGNLDAYGTFYRCTALESITLPSTITACQQLAFKMTNALVNVYISDLAAWCGITFHEDNGHPFYTKSFNNTATHLYLNGTEITDMVIPSTVTNIKDYAFIGCNGIETVTVPSSVLTIGKSVFSGCHGLTSITFEGGLSSVPMFACNQCTALKTVDLPSTVTSIGTCAVQGCNALESFTVRATTPPTLDRDTFNTVTTPFNIYVPAASVADYQAASGWSTYASQIQAIPA